MFLVVPFLGMQVRGCGNLALCVRDSRLIMCMRGLQRTAEHRLEISHSFLVVDKRNPGL